jgi:hypothetical protein
MPLTSAQLATLKTDILADPALAAKPNNEDGAFDIAAAYNATAAPDFWVWRSKVSKDELVGTVGPDGTTFSWTATGYITRAQGERDAFNAIFSEAGFVNPSMANVRTAFGDIFSGTGNAALNRTHLLAVARRKSTRGEKLFASGTGSTASPATMTVEGNLTISDVLNARNLP